MSQHLRLGEIVVTSAQADVFANIDYHVDVKGVPEAPPTSPATTLERLLRDDVWVPRANSSRIRLSITHNQTVGFESVSLETVRSNLYRSLEEAQMWKQLEYAVNFHLPPRMVGDNVIEMVLQLHDQPTTPAGLELKATKASHRIYNGSCPRDVHAPDSMSTYCFEGVTISMHLSQVKQTLQENRSPAEGKASLKSADSGLGMMIRDAPATPPDQQMFDLFADCMSDAPESVRADDDDTLWREDFEAAGDGSEQGEYAGNGDEAIDLFALESPRLDPHVDIRSVVIKDEDLLGMFDLALRAAMTVRPTKTKAGLRFRRSKGFVRLDEVAPAVWKPRALRNMAMQVPFMSTISDICGKQRGRSIRGTESMSDSTLNREAAQRRRDQDGEKLWLLLQKRLLKRGGPSMKLAPVRAVQVDSLGRKTNLDHINLFEEVPGTWSEDTGPGELVNDNAKEKVPVDTDGQDDLWKRIDQI